MLCKTFSVTNTLVLTLLASVANNKVSGTTLDRVEENKAANPIIDIFRQNMEYWSNTMLSTINFIQKCLSGITDVLNSIHVMEREMKQLRHYMTPVFQQKDLLTASSKNNEIGLCVTEKVKNIEEIFANVEQDMQKCMNEKLEKLRDEIQTFSNTMETLKSNVLEYVNLFKRCTKENAVTEAQLMECIKESAAITFPKLSHVLEEQIKDIGNLDFICIFTIANEQSTKLFTVLDELKICFGN